MSKTLIDLRSDTVTRPTPAMRQAMAEAEVGDDVFGDDPTVLRLQEEMARRVGKEAALLLPSGTQSNLVALLSHTSRGDEYIVGRGAHVYRYEGGGAAVLGGAHPHPLDNEANGTLDLAKVEAAIRPVDVHEPPTTLLCLENTFDGKVLSLEYLQRAGELARRRGLLMHLDGARVFNAATALGSQVAEIAAPFDSISVCLSKGLGAPVGSLLCGSQEFIGRAHRWRKTVGGGMRQAGVLAAAGLVALEQHVDRLHEDHDNARSLADALAPLESLGLDPRDTHTNMIWIADPPPELEQLEAALLEQGVLISAGRPLRLVLHRDVSDSDLDRVVGAFRAALRPSHAPAAV